MLNFLLLVLSISDLATGKVYRLKEFEQVLESDLNLGDCDFHGKTIYALTVLDLKMMRIDPIQVESLSFNNQTQTYNITQIAYGMIVDIVKALASACNFKYELHLGKKITSYGTVIEFPNGTIQGTGLYQYLTQPSDFDLLLADFSYTPERMKFSDFLPPFSGK